MTRVRLVQIANFVGPTSGGMRYAVEALGRGYVAAGVERVLVVPGPDDRVRRGPDGTVVHVRSPRVGTQGYRLVLRPWQVTRLLAELTPDALELHDKTTLLPAAWWARRRDVRTTLLSHERMDHMLALRTGTGPLARVAAGALDRVLVRSVDQVVVTSSFAEEEFAEAAAAAGCGLDRVPLGVDLATFRPHRPHAFPHGREDDADILRLVLVGRLSREKSPRLAVATALELHRRGVPVHLDVHGDGPERDALERMARGAPVTFHGHVPDRARVAAALASADLSLSVCPGETFGLAALESLACGTPLVTADRGGARELVDATCGGWAAPEPAALADAVLRVAGGPRGAGRRAARLRAEAYSWDRAVDRMLAIHFPARASVDLRASA